MVLFVEGAGLVLSLFLWVFWTAYGELVCISTDGWSTGEGSEVLMASGL